MKKIFFPNLDGLRFIAFFMVYLWHAFKDCFDPINDQHTFLYDLFYTYANGKTGVSIFFVLSGFLITYIILAEIALKDKLDIPRFYARRTLRIWPLYFLLLIIIFILIPVFSNLAHIDWKKYDMHPWYYFTFLSNFDVLRIYQHKGMDFTPSTVTWSVAIEEQFYLVWPLLFGFVNRNAYKWLFPVIIVGCYAFRIYHHADENVLYFHSISVCGDLALGGYAAYLSINSNKVMNFFKEQSNVFRAICYIIGLAILFLLQILNGSYLHAVGRLLETLFFAYVILDQNFSPSTRFKLGKLSVISRWGKYTYGLYLYHALVLMVFTTIAKILHFNIADPLVILMIGIIAFPCCILISYLSYKYFESIFLRIKLKYAHITT